MARRILLAAVLFGAACSAQTQPAGPVPAKEPAGGRANLAKTPPPFAVTTIGQFSAPFAMAFLSDGSLLVTEKAGRLKLRAPDGQMQDVAGVPTVATGGQGGLLDVAVIDDSKGVVVYLSYAEPGGTGSQLVLARATLLGHGYSGPARLAPPVSDLAHELSGLEVIWRAGSPGQGGQFGANIAFTPDGQSLFLSSGERQRFTPAEDPDQALGKIVHLTLDGKPWPGNPGAGKVGAATVAVIDPPANTAAAASAPVRRIAVAGLNTAPATTWSSGHRNPYGLAFDAGGRLWEVEMGPKGGDEVNLILPGRNYGWPRASNGDNYDGLDIPDHRPGDGFEAPKLWWNPSISPGGMMIYSGTMFPQYRGSMFVAALSGESLIRVTLGDAPKAAEQWDMGTRIRDVAQAPDGSIWLLEDGERGAGGKLLRLAAR